MNSSALSSYARLSLSPSAVSRMMSDFSACYRDGVDINLGVGYVNEETIPTRRILEAMEHVVTHTDHHDKPLNYGGAQGSANLIRSISEYLVRERVGGITAAVLARCSMVIGASGASSILEALGRLFEPGIVITTDPYYYIYCDYLERAGFEILAVAEDDSGIRPDLLKEKIAALGERRKLVRFVYLVTVSNPTSVLMTNQRRAEVLEVLGAAEQGVDSVPVFFDTAYENLLHDPLVTRPVSGLVYDTRGVAYEIGTLSKILAPALRIGYVLGPPGELLNALVQNISDIGFSAPLVMQEAASHLLDNHLSEQVHAVNRGYRQKALGVKKWLDQYLGGEIESLSGGSAGFYYYLTLRSTQTAEGTLFNRFLSRTTGDTSIDFADGTPAPRVSYIPGVYCVHTHGELVEKGKRQLRISYGYESLAQIEEGIKLIAQAVAFSKVEG